MHINKLLFMPILKENKKVVDAAESRKGFKNILKLFGYLD